MGLTHGSRFKEELIVKPAQSFQDLLSQSRGCVKLDKENAFHVSSEKKREEKGKNQLRGQGRDMDEHAFRSSKVLRRAVDQHRQDLLSRGEPNMARIHLNEGRDKEYQFKISKSALVAQLMSHKGVRWPTKISKDLSFREKNRYCKFHDNHGHLISECWQLNKRLSKC